MRESTGVKMDKKRYFVSTFVWEKKRPKNFNNFYEARQEAITAAEDGVKKGFSNLWADEYVNNIQPESPFWWYEDMIRLYADSLFNKVSEQETAEKIKEIEHTWLEMDRFNNTYVKFIVELSEKELAGHQDIALPCPVCKDGTVHNVNPLLEDPLCNYMVRYGCDKCDYGFRINRITSASDESTGSVCDGCTTNACGCLSPDSQLSGFDQID